MIDIKRKKVILEKAAANLKKEFFGIDDIIDKIIENISGWFLFPELSTRPQIVCLFGLTGVGKTELIRKLCNELGVNSDFAEIQLNGSKNQGTIKEILSHTTITSKSHSVLLLDEIQRFKTKDEEGSDILDGSMQDIWMLLSDGTLGSRNSLKTELLSFLTDLNSDIYDIEDKEKKKNVRVSDQENPDEEESSEVSEPSLDCDDDDDDDDNPYCWSKKYNANKLYSFDDNHSKEEYINMSLYQQRDKVVELLSDSYTFIPKPYTKMLIFISGNIDEAFDVATQASGVDVDADLIHEQTKNISVLDVKDALLRRFKPEQIARFGNNYVIYPSLNKTAYEKIIKRKVDDFCKSASALLKDNGYSLSICETILKMLYHNGVYPAQGARPILSTIDNFINSVICKSVVDCDMNEKKGEIFISCKEEGKVNYECGDYSNNIKFTGELDKIRNKQASKDNRTALTAVHEAGHTALLCILFGISPSEVRINLASSKTSGFVYNNVNPCDKDGIIKLIKVLYAGHAAEEIVFGKKYVTDGSKADIERATSNLIALTRLNGNNIKDLDDHKLFIGDDYACHYTNQEDTNHDIKVMSSLLFRETKELLIENQEYLIDLARELKEKKELNQKEISLISEKHNIIALCQEVDDEIVQYSTMFEEWSK